jgi:hypothetical protein
VTLWFSCIQKHTREVLPEILAEVGHDRIIGLGSEWNKEAMRRVRAGFELPGGTYAMKVLKYSLSSSPSKLW